MSTAMRAKMYITNVVESSSLTEKVQNLTFSAVCRKGGYADTEGMDEDNTYAYYSPQANLQMTILNPALVGRFSAGDTFYVDFTPVPEEERV